MRAVVIARPGGPEVLELREVPAPQVGPGRILVRVAASGVNRADLLQRRGGYPAPPGWPREIPGLEYAGTVEAVGEGVQRFAPGDAVMGLVGGGGYAELVAVDAAEALPVPAGMPLQQAAAIPEVFLTAHDGLMTQLGLQSGEWLLVHAVGSGVGTAALQLARAAGARVLGTSRSTWKLERARALGLDVAIPVTGDADWAEVVLHETGGRGVDTVLDLVGGAYLAGNIRCLTRLGRLLVVGLVAGSRAELDLGAVLARRLRIQGTAMRSRTPAERAAVVAAFEKDALPLFQPHHLHPIVETVLPARDAALAHERMERNEAFGKIVLSWEPGAA
jgi:NADPH2:quinone reductase